jgi:hypothetical protein
VSLSLAAGLPVLGHLNVLPHSEAVVHLSGEGHAGMKRRIAAWGKDADELGPHAFRTEQVFIDGRGWVRHSNTCR